MITIVGISGSLTPDSRTTRLVKMALDYAAGAGDVTTDLLDLRTVREFCDGRPHEAYSADTRAAIEKVEAADALIVGTPIYRGSYTGAFKNLFDLVRNEPMRGKVVGLIATGGSDHHFLALEHQLRPLFGFFRAHTVPGVVYAQNAHFVNGELDPSIQDRLHRLATDVVALGSSVRHAGAGPAYPKIERKPGEG